MAEDTRWAAYDDELKAARNQVNTQVRSAERSRAQAQEDINTVERYAIYLTGNYADAEGNDLLNAITLINDVVPMIEANNAATNQSLTLEDFFVGPQRVNFTVEDDGVLVTGNFDFRRLAEVLAQDTSALRTPGSIRRAIGSAEQVYETSITDLSTFDDRIAEAEATLEYLEPKQELLDSDNARDQVRGLSIWGDVTDDDIIGRLEVQDKPSALTAEMREQFAAVRETVSPEAQRRDLRATVDSKLEVEDAPSSQEAQQAEFDAILERKRQEIAAARVTPQEREGQRMAAMNEMGYDLGGAPAAPAAPAPAPSAPAPAPRATGGMPGDGTPSWVQRGTGELTSQRYDGPGGHGMAGAVSRTEAPEAKSDDQQFLDLIELGFSPDVAYNAVYGSSPSGGGGSGQPARPSAAEIEAANREDVEAFLRGQFGGFDFFLDKHDAELHVGLTSDGLIVDADDPSAMTTKNVLDVIVEQGLTDPGRIEGALGHTEWWQTTDAQARVFDVTYENLNELERLEYVEPTMDLIREELQFLGAEMSDEEKQELAADLMRLGDQGDQETVRDMIIDRLGSFDPGASSLSDFAAARDEIEEMSRRYFVPIDTATAGQYAQDIYLGDRTSTQIEQYFKEHAVSKFPTLENAIKGGFTPEEYFAPYKYEIERMLGRPNVNLYDEFADVIEYFPDTGGDQPRPMTMHEVRKYVRGLPEWQQSYQGQQSAEALAFAIGKTFGEVA